MDLQRARDNGARGHRGRVQKVAMLAGCELHQRPQTGHLRGKFVLVALTVGEEGAEGPRVQTVREQDEQAIIELERAGEHLQQLCTAVEELEEHRRVVLAVA